MLAGRVRLRTFLLVGALVGIVVCGAGGKAWYDQAERDRVEAEKQEAIDRARREAEAEAARAAAQAADHGRSGREVDGVVFGYLGKPMEGDKLKDVSEGSAFKVNVYKDPGNDVANRAKVDLDRDEKWDETFTFKDGKTTREVSPNDDEQYTERFEWTGSDWVGEGAAPAAAAADTTVVGATATREEDRVALSYIGKDIGTDKLKDVTKGKPFKVNVYQDAGNTSANRAKIDLDRNDKWDEKLTFEPGKITREVAPADDESYTETYHWDGSTWVPQ